MIIVKEIPAYKDYGRCLHISNEVIEAVTTLDIGPRIVRFAFIGGKNLMNTNREALGFRTDKAYTDLFGPNKRWELFGGHRIWTSPEAWPETYTPDDEQVRWTATQKGAVFNSRCLAVGLGYSLEIIMDEDDANMQIKMSVRNISDTSKRFSVWGLSVCAAGGLMIIPMNNRDTGLLHNRHLSVWPYTDMSDPRIRWGRKYVTLRQDTSAATPIKLGFDLEGGTAYYLLGKDILRKRFDTLHPEARYPDGGCSFETYTNNVMLEFETLSELKTIAPQEEATLVENWSLFKAPSLNPETDEDIDRLLSALN